MSRRLKDIIPTAPSRRAPQAAEQVNTPREAKVEPPDSCDRFETASIPSHSGLTEGNNQTTPTTLVKSEHAPVTEPAAPRRSTRERRLPARFKDYVM